MKKLLFFFSLILLCSSLIYSATINVPGDYATIQAAINAASPYDIINVAAGTYAGNITVNKSLTILGDPGDANPGPGVNAPIIDGGSLPGDAFYIANGVTDVTIKGFEMRNFTSPSLDGIGNGISAWVGSTSNITIQDNYFHDLGYNSILVGNDYSSNPANWGDHTNWLVKNNIAANVGYIGFELTNTSNSSIEDNVIHLNTPEIGAVFSSARRNETGLTIKNNQIDGTPSAAFPVIYLYAYDLDMPSPNLNSVLIENNTISTIGTPFQIYIRNIGTGTVTGVTVVNNNLLTLKNLTSETVNASGNWWGDLDPSDNLNGSVDYTPWLNVGTDMSGDPGFQPNLSTLWVDDDSPQSGTTGRIQEAVDLVSGSTINILPGTYIEPSQVVINKNVTMIGASKSNTFIKPGFSTGSSGDSRGFILVQSGFTFNLSQVTIDGTGQLVWQGIRHMGTGTINDCNITNIKYNASGPDYGGTGIAAFGTPAMNVNVTNCNFSEIGRVGILYFGSGITGSTYSNNTYVGKGTGDWLDYGVEFGGGAIGSIDNCVISNCKGVASVDGSTSSGILVTTYYGAGTSATITNSTITNNAEGIAVGYDAADVSTVVANGNNISNNTAYGISSTNPLVDAKNNWWGDASGPLDNKILPGNPNYNNPGGLGSEVTSYVDYEPWNVLPDYFNTPATAYQIYLSSSATVIDSMIYPNTNWGITSYEPNDWDFTAPIEFYIVPQVGSQFGACDITLEWDNTMYSFGSVVNDGIFSPYNLTFFQNQLGTTTRITIQASRTDNLNFNTVANDYIAKVTLNLLKPGYGTLNFNAMDFRYYNGSGGQLGVYVNGKNAKVKSYLGDVATPPSTESTGDGLVNGTDLAYWSASYWSGVPGYVNGMTYYKVKYDIGPTTTNTVYGLPTTDAKIQFEDLVIFAMSYGLSGNGVYPKIKPVPETPVELSIGQPLASGSQTLLPIYINGTVQDLRAASLVLSGKFGKFLGAENGDLLTSYTSPVMVLGRSEGSKVYVDLSLVGADVTGISQEGQLVLLRFEGNTNVNITSADLRNMANSTMLVKLNGDSKGIPTEFGLAQNYPNPFNPSTLISYQLPVQTAVQIDVFNVVGEKVAQLVNEVKEPGYYEVTWNASSMTSGVYLFRINAGDFSAVKKMLLMK